MAKLPRYSSVGSYPLVYLTLLYEKTSLALCADCAQEKMGDEDHCVLPGAIVEGDEPVFCDECSEQIE